MAASSFAITSDAKITAVTPAHAAGTVDVTIAFPNGTPATSAADQFQYVVPNVDAIRGSLAVYGQRKPVVVNRRTGTIEAGNGTLQAVLSLGWTHLAAVYVDDDPATAAGYAIADNRTAQLAEWDKKALDKLLREVSTKSDERLNGMLAELAKELELVPAEEAAGPAGDREKCPTCGRKMPA